MPETLTEEIRCGRPREALTEMVWATKLGGKNIKSTGEC